MKKILAWTLYIIGTLVWALGATLIAALVVTFCVMVYRELAAKDFWPLLIPTGMVLFVVAIASLLAGRDWAAKELFRGGK